MFAQPRAVLVFNNDMLVIVTAMTGKYGSEFTKSALLRDVKTGATR